MATHSNGMSAQQLMGRLGSYKTAWLLCAKLRRAMVDPERDPLVGVVEVDETTIAHRTAGDPVPPRPGRSLDGRLPIAAAVDAIVHSGAAVDAEIERLLTRPLRAEGP